jgi:hypothetical protein
MTGDSKYQKTVSEGYNGIILILIPMSVHVQGATKSECEIKRNTLTTHPVWFPIQSYKVAALGLGWNELK